MRGLIVYGLLAISAILVVQSDALKCHSLKIGDFPVEGEWAKLNLSSEVQCKTTCGSVFIESDEKRVADVGICSKKGKMNMISAAWSEHIKNAKFECTTDLCNTKNSSQYEQSMTLRNSLSKVATKLEGKDEDLKCFDEKGTSAACEGFCAIVFNTDGTVDETVTRCMNIVELHRSISKYQKQAGISVGNYGIDAEVFYNGKQTKTRFTVYCSKTDCNNEESLVKEFEGIMTKISGKLTIIMPSTLAPVPITRIIPTPELEELDSETFEPEATTSYSNGYSLFFFIILVLAVFNM